MENLPTPPSPSGPQLEITVFTLFPEWFEQGPMGDSIIERARRNEVLRLRAVDFRRWATDRHQTVDAPPYGGGGGMVILPDPLARAMDETIGSPGTPGRPLVLLTSPRGRPFDQEMALRIAAAGRVAILCGHYEGFDERLIESRVDEEVSLGDFVLTGGEIPAMAMIDAAARLLPGVLGNEDSSAADTFMDGLLEAGHYTRPPEFEGRPVPEVLLSGNHEAIRAWREEEGLRLTRERRPDLHGQLLLHPAQVRRLARRARPFVLFRRGKGAEEIEVLFATAGVRQLPDFPRCLAGVRSEGGVTPDVRVAEIREARELAPWGPDALAEEVQDWLQAGEPGPGPDRPAAFRFARNLLRQLLRNGEKSPMKAPGESTATHDFQGGNSA